MRRRQTPGILATLVPLLLAAGCQPQPQTSGEQLLRAADASYRQGDYQETVRQAGAFITQHGGAEAIGEAHYLRGLAYARLRDRTRAKLDFEQALNRARRSDLRPLARVSLGNLYFENWQLAQAARLYEQTVAGLPDQPPKAEVLYRLGLCHARLGNWERARGYFSRALHLFADSDVAPAARRYVAASGFTVQCGAFADWQNARRQVEMLKQQGLAAEQRMDTHGVYHLVQVGRYRTYEDARAALARVRGYVADAIIVP
jgi:tetratricopeptide (TPR) repeat protein